MWLLEIFKGREERPLGIRFDQTNCVSKNFQNWPLKNAADLRGYHSYLLSLLEITGGGGGIGDTYSSHPKHCLIYRHCF